MSALVTDSDINLLRSAGNWLLTRSQAYYFAAYKRLMREYGISLLQLADKLQSIAVEKPVKLDELFRKKD